VKRGEREKVNHQGGGGDLRSKGFGRNWNFIFDSTKGKKIENRSISSKRKRRVNPRGGGESPYPQGGVKGRGLRRRTHIE